LFESGVKGATTRAVRAVYGKDGYTGRDPTQKTTRCRQTVFPEKVFEFRAQNETQLAGGRSKKANGAPSLTKRKSPENDTWGQRACCRRNAPSTTQRTRSRTSHARPRGKILTKST